VVGPDPAFDTRAIEWLANGSIDAILDAVSHESLARSGNASSAFLGFILMLGIAGPIRASHVDEIELFGSRELYLTWYPEQDPR
jgi:protocatechuate 4,5-dioxygenase beta chain